MLYIFLGVILLVLISGIIVLNLPVFGKIPSGERLARIEKSPNYKDGIFQNYNSTAQKSSKGIVQNLYEIFIKGIEGVRPSKAISVVKTDLKNLNPSENVLIWLGHSAYYLQLGGKIFLIDPTLVSAAPFSFMNKPFEGTDIYTPDDIPSVDYLLITHDHYDHLDYQTVIQLKDKIGKIITGLGVGEHFEHWGFSSEKITELDWNEHFDLANGFKITALPVRHYSGRGVIRNKSLWVSYMLETPLQTIYFGGDSGYDTFYKQIGEQFPNIDLAILENGQYNEDWRYIHILPQEIPLAFNDLQAKRLLTSHHGKYALAKHIWQDPLENVYKNTQENHIPLLTPKIGEVIFLDDENQTFTQWWK